MPRLLVTPLSALPGALSEHAPSHLISLLSPNHMIETPEGLANVDAIAALEGVDVVHIGLNDLLVAMGKPGAFGSAEQADAVEKVIAACKKHGKIPGVGGDRNLARQAEFIRKGALFITTNSEIAFMMAEGTRVTTELRKAIG